MTATAMMNRFVLIAAVVAGSAIARAQEAPQAVGEKEDVARLTLVKSTDGKAVIRFRQSPLQIVAVGDRVGKTRATVVTIAPGRLVLEEVTTGSDGKPLRAEIVIRDGETGGKRFLRHPDLNAP